MSGVSEPIGSDDGNADEFTAGGSLESHFDGLLASPDSRTVASNEVVQSSDDDIDKILAGIPHDSPPDRESSLQKAVSLVMEQEVVTEQSKGKLDEECVSRGSKGSKKRKTPSSILNAEGKVDSATAATALEMRVQADKRVRGKYKCGKCGAPKEGHVCEVDDLKLRRQTKYDARTQTRTPFCLEGDSHSSAPDISSEREIRVSDYVPWYEDHPQETQGREISAWDDDQGFELWLSIEEPQSGASTNDTAQGHKPKAKEGGDYADSRPSGQEDNEDKIQMVAV